MSSTIFGYFAAYQLIRQLGKIRYKLKAEIVLDETDVLNQLDELINNSKNMQVLEETRAVTDAALTELERLKAELEMEKDKNRQLQLQKEYDAEASKLSAIEYFEKGSNLTSVDADNFKEAAGWFQKAVDADSTFAEAWFKLGQCRYFTDDFGLARTSLQKAYDLNQDTYALVWIGNCYKGLNDYYTAITYFQRSYDQSNDLDDLARVAECYHDLDNDEEAKKIYEHILALDPNNFTATNYVSLVYLDLKEYDKAIACYYKLLDMEADPANMYGSIASAYNDKQDYASAQVYYQKVVELDPDAWYQWSYLAAASFNNADYPTAITALKRALLLNPEDVWAENLLGRSYENLSDMNNAKKYHLMAAKHGNEDSRTWCAANSLSWE